MGVSLTVDNLDADTLAQLHAEASRRGIDVGMLVKELICHEFALLPSSASPQTHHDLDALAGTWTPEEADAFLASTAGFRRCDEDLWK